MKTKIIIDCSTIFYKVVNRVCGYNGKNIKSVLDSGRKYLTTKDEQDSLLQLVHDEFSKLNNYTTLLGTDGIYFAFDTLSERSFRYGLHPEYKSSKARKKEVVFDREIFKKLIEKYYNTLLEKGFKVIEYAGVEADDIFYEFTQIIDDSYNIGIITTDSDMNQLLNHRTFVYHPIDYKTIISPDFRMGNVQSDNDTEDEGDALSFFFGKSRESEMQNNGYAKFFSNNVVIDPKMELFKKVIIGDDMDNIPTFFKYHTKNGKSEFGFTSTRYKQLFEKYGSDISLDMLYDDDKDGFLDLLGKFSTVVGRDLDHTRINEYRSTRDFNRAMIDLSESSKYHKSSPELIGIIRDQMKKPMVHFGVVHFYDDSTQTY